jgi:hypothetical protein
MNKPRPSAAATAKKQSTAVASRNRSTAATAKKQSPPASKRSKKPAPVDPLDTLGLNGFARTLGVAPDSVLAVTSTLLAGLAGSEAWLQAPWGKTRLAKLDLLTSKEDFGMQRLIDCLTAPLSLMNRRLVEKAGLVSPDGIDLVTSGPFASAAAAKTADPEMRDKALRRYQEALTPVFGPGESGLLRQDLAYDPVPHRREALLYPQFLLKGVDGRSLKPLVEACHRRTALVVQPTLGLAREGTEPSRVIKLLFSLLDGMIVKKRSGPLDRRRDSSLPAKAHALLSLAKDEIGVLASMGVGHLNRFLWVAESVPQPGKPGDGDACEVFLAAWQNAHTEILELRRDGRALMIPFESGAGLAAFEKESRRYEAEIIQTAAEAEAWARGLPQAIFWSLAFLRPSIPGDHGMDDDSLTAAAFAAARRLVRNHHDQARSIFNAQLLEERRALAGRIVEEVSRAQSPMTFRDIVRCFSIQTKERFTRVIEALIEAGVLSRDENGHHVPGPADMADAAEILDQKLVLP